MIACCPLFTILLASQSVRAERARDIERAAYSENRRAARARFSFDTPVGVIVGDIVGLRVGESVGTSVGLTAQPFVVSRRDRVERMGGDSKAFEARTSRCSSGRHRWRQCGEARCWRHGGHDRGLRCSRPRGGAQRGFCWRHRTAVTNATQAPKHSVPQWQCYTVAAVSIRSVRWVGGQHSGMSAFLFWIGRSSAPV